MRLRVVGLVAARGILATPVGAQVQPVGKVCRMGFLSGGSAPSPAIPLILEALRALGYVEGRNLVVEPRFADAKLDRLPTLAAELVQLKVDLIMTTGTPATRAAKQATATVPVVFNLSADPVQESLVASFARPGGNLTGFAFGLYDDKRLEILKEAVPSASRVACLCEQDASILGAARVLRVQVQFLEVRGPHDLDRAVAAAASARAEALLVPDVQWLFQHQERIADLVAKSRLPAVGNFRNFAAGGGLLSYGAKAGQSAPRLAAQVDRIFKGSKPGDLPVEQPTRFELIVNLRAAKALGLTIPQSMLLRADELIQ